MNANYCPESNRIRIYPSGTRVDSILDESEYSSFKSCGYKWAGAQECFVAPWSPAAEDWALELCGEIGDEDYSPEERAADRAERFSGYRDKRRSEANSTADTFEAGPSAFGHANRNRAERQANRHDRYRTRAVSQWSKAEYWQTRTAGVIGNALHKSTAAVRRDRILRLEAEQRKHEKNREEYKARFEAWHKVYQLEGADNPVICIDYGISKESTPAAIYAYSLANSSGCWGEYKHPRQEKTGSIYDLMRHADPITAREAAELWLSDAGDPADPDTNTARWSAHYALRLAYENQMLENEGGKASEVDIEPGGWIYTGNRTGRVLLDVKTGWKQVQSVNRSPVTKRVVSVKVWGTSSGYTKESGYKEYATVPRLVSMNIERAGADSYRAPTDEERAQFATATKERKRAAKENKTATPTLLNPTDADAEKLQALWNARAAELHAKHRTYGEYRPTEIIRTTQAEYSASSKGSYTSFETVEVCENGLRPRRWDGNKRAENPPVAFKIRKRFGSGGFTAQADAVVILTDKPQKALPLNWEAVMSKPAEVATVNADGGIETEHGTLYPSALCVNR